MVSSFRGWKTARGKEHRLSHAGLFNIKKQFKAVKSATIDRVRDIFDKSCYNGQSVTRYIIGFNCKWILSNTEQEQCTTALVHFTRVYMDMPATKEDLTHRTSCTIFEKKSFLFSRKIL